MNLPKNETDRQILAEFINKYHTSQWLRGANVIENHPTRFCKTIEVHVNYRPVNSMVELLSFAESKGCALEFIQVQ